MRNTLIQKTDFGKIWQAIQSDRRPINQQKLHEEFKVNYEIIIIILDSDLKIGRKIKYQKIIEFP